MLVVCLGFSKRDNNAEFLTENTKHSERQRQQRRSAELKRGTQGRKDTGK